MAYILGVGTPTHDSGACLLRDGVLIFAVNEERLTREKLTGSFPKKSIEACLAFEKLTPRDIQCVALGLWAGANSKSLDFLELTKRMLEDDIALDAGARAVVHERLTVQFERDTFFHDQVVDDIRALGFEDRQVRWCNHHECHALSAFYSSPFTDALVVTFDGRGDLLSGTVYNATRERGLVKLDVSTFLDSLAYLYSITTQFLGFRSFHHEGKLTGLSSAGNPTETLPIFRKAFSLREIDGKWRMRANLDGQYYKPFSSARPPMLEKELQGFSKEDVAAGVQALTEEIVCQYLTKNNYLHQRICLAGGLFANVRLNARIRALPGVERVYAYPHMGDGGIAHGAALTALRDSKPSQLASFRLGELFLGPCEANLEEITAAIEDRTWRNCAAKGGPLGAPAASSSVIELRDQEELVAAIVAQLESGRVVGLCFGRMEYGPRALGHRSLLLNTFDNDLSDRLNARLQRSEFMPFAPVTLAEHAASMYQGWTPERPCGTAHMTMCYQVTDEMRKLSPAVVHVDGSARPQVVTPVDGLYFRILEEYHRKTGIPSLINTSFNAHGEPIVGGPEDALRSFAMGCCDDLVLPPFLLKGGPVDGSGVPPAVHPAVLPDTPWSPTLRPAKCPRI